MVRAIFLLFFCNLSAQSNQSIFLILNQYEDNERNIIEIRSSWKIHYLSWKKFSDVLRKLIVCGLHNKSVI